MIDPINSRDYYAYKKINTEMGTAANGQERFGLQKDAAAREEEEDRKKSKGERDGVVVELSGSHVGKNQKDGVVSGRPGQQTEENGSRTFADIRAFLKQVAEAFGNFWSGIRQALYDFWNSDSTAGQAERTEDTAEEETAEASVEEAGEAVPEEAAAMAGQLTGEASGADRMNMEDTGADRIEPSSQKMSLYDGSGQVSFSSALSMTETEEERRQRIRAYMEQTEPGSYVKNSDLLTYYDRTGKFVRLNGADKNRILHGDERDRRYMRP